MLAKAKPSGKLLWDKELTAFLDAADIAIGNDISSSIGFRPLIGKVRPTAN